MFSLFLCALQALLHIYIYIFQGAIRIDGNISNVGVSFFTVGKMVA